jgi:oxysterol-binding protein 1
MYNFSPFTIELNELESNVAPTDSRLRPDIRLMEESKWDEADKMKIYLEDKQRNKLRPEEYKPNAIWFEKVICMYTNKVRFEFTHEYWRVKERQDWEKSPNIF